MPTGVSLKVLTSCNKPRVMSLGSGCLLNWSRGLLTDLLLQRQHSKLQLPFLVLVQVLKLIISFVSFIFFMSMAFDYSLPQFHSLRCMKTGHVSLYLHDSPHLNVKVETLHVYSTFLCTKFFQEYHFDPFNRIPMKLNVLSANPSGLGRV